MMAQPRKVREIAQQSLRGEAGDKIPQGRWISTGQRGGKPGSPMNDGIKRALRADGKTITTKNGTRGREEKTKGSERQKKSKKGGFSKFLFQR